MVTWPRLGALPGRVGAAVLLVHQPRHDPPGLTRAGTSPRRPLRTERVDYLRHLRRRTGEGEYGGLNARVGELREPLALRPDQAEQEDLADEALRCELERTLAVARVPRLDDRLDLLATAEPAEEIRVDRNGGVGDECALRHHERLLLRAVNREEATGDLLVRPVERAQDPLDVAQRQEVREHPVRLLRRELQHPLSQCGEHDRYRFCGR